MLEERVERIEDTEEKATGKLKIAVTYKVKNNDGTFRRAEFEMDNRMDKEREFFDCETYPGFIALYVPQDKTAILINKDDVLQIVFKNEES